MIPVILVILVILVVLVTLVSLVILVILVIRALARRAARVHGGALGEPDRGEGLGERHGRGRRHGHTLATESSHERDRQRRGRCRDRGVRSGAHAERSPTRRTARLAASGRT